MNYYIQDKRDYVGNDMLFWSKGGNGYTTDLDKAWLVSKEHARRICEDRKTDVAWPEKHLRDVCKTVVDMQYVDNKKKIFKRGKS